MFTMTPQARSITAFTLAFLLLTGYLNRIAYAAIGFSGDSLSGRTGGTLFSLLMGAVAIGLLVFARAASAAQEGWAQSLAEAAAVLIAVSLAIIVVNLFGFLIKGDEYFGGAFGGYHVFDAIG
jgi:hypothetical protein